MAIPTITNNSPSAGSFAWGAFTIQLNGVAYGVGAGSSNQRWVWWEYRNGSPILNAGPEVPAALKDEDLVLFANKNGIGVRVQSSNFIDGELLVDGSIFADALSTNLINSQHIVTAGLDAGVIKFGVMSGDRIQVNTLQGDRILANTIGASKLIVTDFSNYVTLDPNVAASRAEYSTLLFANEAARGTGYSLKVDTTTGVVNNVGQKFDVGQNDEFYLSWWHKRVGSDESTYLNVRTEDGAGTPVDYWLCDQVKINGVAAALTALQTIADNTWVFVEARAKVTSASAKQAYPTVRKNVASTTGGYVLLDEMYVMKKSAGKLIVDGSIDSLKVVTQGLDAGVIKFGTMSGDRITANTIDSNKIVTAGLDAGVIKFGSMSGARITAGTIDSTHIVTAGLDAGKIKFGSMSGALITSGTLDAGKITFGTMSGDRITANTINSNHVVTVGLDAATIKFGTMSGARITANTLDAGTLKSGSAFTNDLSVASTFTLGTATAGGVFQSYNFAGSATGFQLTNTGFTLKGGTITGSTLATEKSAAGYYIQTLNSGDRPVLQFNIGAGREQPSIQSDTAGAPNLFLYSGASPQGREVEVMVQQGKFRVGIEADADVGDYNGAYFTFERDNIDFHTDQNIASGTQHGRIQVGSNGDAFFGYQTGEPGNQRGFWCQAEGTIVRAYTAGSFEVVSVGAGSYQPLKAEKIVSTANGIFMDDLSGGGNTQANIGNAGRIQRASSSKRYKTDIMPMSIAVARRALDLKSVLFRLINEGDVPAEKRHFYPGMIAEQADEVGMKNWVSYNADGQPDGFRYGELTSAHNMLIKELYGRVKKLEATIAELA